MKKYILGICAIMLAVSLSFAMSAFKKSKAYSTNKPMTSYYYEFEGTHGDEDNMSLWIQLPTVDDYNDFNCPSGSTKSCKIINTTNSGGHPTDVPLDANSFPVQGSVNTAVKLKQ